MACLFSFSSPVDPGVLAADSCPPGFVQSDTPCVRCGYSVRGLSPLGRCPECGTPVDRTLRGDLLAYCDPHYVRTLLVGTRLVVASVYSFVIMLIGVGIGLGSLMSFYGRIPPGWALSCEIWLLATWAAFALGWWALTIPDAGQLTTNRGQRPRRIVRVSLLPSSIAITAPFIAGAWGSPSPDVSLALGLLSLLAVTTGFFASMLYVRWLAARIPNLQAVARSVTLMKTIGIATAALALIATRNGGLIAIAILGVGLTYMIVLSSYCTMFSWLRESLVSIGLRQTAREELDHART